MTYDMTFLVLFLTSLYEADTRELQLHCPVHPVKKIPMLQNELSAYGAKMNILLTYFKFEDDWKDDKSLQEQQECGFSEKGRNHMPGIQKTGACHPKTFKNSVCL